MKKILIYIIIVSCMLYIPLSAAPLPEYKNYQYIKPSEILGEDGTLILSNSPETVKEKGILYCEQLLGKGRLVFHHVNATHENDQRLLIVVKNLTKSEQRFEVHQEGYSMPHYHYLEAGNRLLKDYYGCMTSKVYFLKPDEQMVLYDSAPYEWKQQMVLSGMLDVYATNQVEILFAVIGKNDTLDCLSELKALDIDLAPRGTFTSLTKYQYIILPKKQNAYFLIEDEKTDWLKGVDRLTGKCAINYGNYGVLYKVQLIAQEDTTVFVCPRGGIFQGIIRWENGEMIQVARKHFFKTIKERINIGVIKKNEVRTLEYILPNGSAAPILLGFDINV
ncbi:MAG: hypothetical protein J6F30_10155 [Cellulosilyticum sp.]|nr:hypothetical protein [Cellulosilyticum sp.]